MSQRKGGIIQVQRNGEILDAKGDFTVGYGRPLKTAIIGADRVHGNKHEVQVPYIEGAITDRGSLDLADLFDMDGETITLVYANGKSVALADAWFAGEGTVTTSEGEVAVRWEGTSLEEVN